MGLEERDRVQVTALASGSSGNAYLVRAGDTAVLLDAGVPAAALERYMRAQGVAPAALAAIFVSHEHVDHVRGAGLLARRYRIPIVANAATLRAAATSLGTLPEALTLAAGQECRLGTLTVRTFPLPHDAADTVGFRVEAEGCCVCVCTDLGEPSPGLDEELEAADSAGARSQP